MAAFDPFPVGSSALDRLHLLRRRRVRPWTVGPLLDRIDLQIALRQVSIADLTRTASGEPSAVVRERALAARAVQWSTSEGR